MAPQGVCCKEGYALGSTSLALALGRQRFECFIINTGHPGVLGKALLVDLAEIVSGGSQEGLGGTYGGLWGPAVSRGTWDESMECEHSLMLMQLSGSELA